MTTVAVRYGTAAIPHGHTLFTSVHTVLYGHKSMFFYCGSDISAGRSILNGVSRSIDIDESSSSEEEEEDEVPEPANLAVTNGANLKMSVDNKHDLLRMNSVSPDLLGQVLKFNRAPR